MLKRTITGVLLAGFLVGILFLRQVSLAFFDAAVIVAMLLSVYELVRVFKEHMTVPAVVLIAAFALFVYPAYLFLGGLTTVLLSAVAAFALLNVVLLFDSKATLGTTDSFLFMLFYPVIMLSLMFEVNNRGLMEGLLGLLLILGVSAITDTFALLTGKLIGGKKLCPSISPNKTVAGAVGGLVGGTGAAIAVWAIFMESANSIFSFPGIPSVAVFALLGFAGSVLTQLGDLVASSLKRKVGVKDFGSIFPGHGGIVDRIDGILYNTLLVFGFYAIFL